MHATDLAVLIDHVYWMRDRILAAADHPDVQFTKDGAGDGSMERDLRAVLVHELDVEWSWRERLRAADRTRFAPDDLELVPGDLADVGAIRSHWAADERVMRGWGATLTDADLASPCRVEHEGSHPFWFHLQHVYSHAVQQFADAAAILTRAGRSPGELEFLEFVRDRDHRS